MRMAVPLIDPSEVSPLESRGALVMLGPLATRRRMPHPPCPAVSPRGRLPPKPTPARQPYRPTRPRQGVRSAAAHALAFFASPPVSLEWCPTGGCSHVIVGAEAASPCTERRWPHGWGRHPSTAGREDAAAVGAALRQAADLLRRVTPSHCLCPHLKPAGPALGGSYPRPSPLTAPTGRIGRSSRGIQNNHDTHAATADATAAPAPITAAQITRFASRRFSAASFT